MKTTKEKIAIHWIATPPDDWNGVELIDSVTGDCHAIVSTATPEALALIGAAPKLLALLKRHQHAGGNDIRGTDEAIKQAEGKG
jgi:hypothetical protein